MLISRRSAMLAGAATMLGGKVLGAETIKIGQTAPFTGPGAEWGRFEVNGARLALDAVNAAGGVLGRPMEIVTEDDQTTNPGAVLSFSRLSARDDIVAFLGPIASTQTHAVAPDALKAAKPMMFGGTDPVLTHMGNRWLFRCRPNDNYSSRVIATYGVDGLKKRNWVIVHSTDAFGTSGMKGLVDALDKFGIKPILVQGYANQTPDFTAVVLAIKQSGAEMIGSYMTFPADQAVFARQLRQLGVTIGWISSPTGIATTTLNLGGAALYGTYAVADFSPDSSPEAHAYADRYEQTFKLRPDNFSSWSFDAVTILARAINAAGNTDPESIRNAIIGIRGFKGVEGEYNFDANGDGLRGYNIVRNDGGKIVFERHIEFTD